MNQSSSSYPYADLTLARRLERAEGHASRRFVEARARLEPDSGAAFVEVADGHVMFDGVESPLTQTFGLGMSGPVSDAQFDDIETFFSSRGAPTFHEVCPLADPTAIASLNGRGYVPFEFSNVLYRPLANGSDEVVSPAPGVTVRVASVAERDSWAQTAAAAWGDTPEFGAFMLAFGRIIAASDDSFSFLGELDGRMAGTGSLILHGGVALLAGASTIPEARRHGVQTALLASRLRHAAEHGCDLAMIVAQPGSSSQRNAERNGFRIAYTRIKWRKLSTE
jgi:GNAT superfamily N-acetyltransferase